MLKILSIAALVMMGSAAQADRIDQLESCRYTCSQACESLEAEISSALRSYRNSCNSNPDPRPPRGGGVEIYHSDSCSSQLIASVSEYSNCNTFEQSGTSAWGVKINGVCHNIQDMSVGAACRAFAGGASRDNVEIYHSDSCVTNMLAMVSPLTDCMQFEDTGTAAWGVKINGVCQNIQDMSLQRACATFSNSNSRQSVKIYHSDSCSSQLIATVGRRTNCEAFPSTGTDAWGVEINGVCQNIQDMSVQQACESFKGSGRR